MKKINEFLRSRKATPLLAALAAVLLAGSGIGFSKAQLTIFSDTYSSRVEMQDIGISLLENGNVVSHRDYDSSKADGSWDEEVPGVLLGNMIENGKKLVFEKEYPEAISVQNSGTVNAYVRVSIYRYWTDKDGNKMTALTPELIDLNFVNPDSWIEDKDTNTATRERKVFYYNKLLNAGDTTPDLTDTISISNAVAKKVTQTRTGNKIVTTYDYDGVKFHVEAHVDAVQEHNAEEAIKSAWGRSVSISGTTLSLD